MEPYQTSNPDQQRQIRVTVQHRIEESAEARHAIGFPRHAAVHHVEQSGADDHRAGPPELSHGEQHRRADVNHQAQKRQYVGMDFGERQPAHDQADDLLQPAPIARVKASCCLVTFILTFYTTDPRLAGS